MLTYQDYLGSRRFSGLDGLRAIAAVLVVGSHFGGWWPLLNGWLGVQMFFVLSGYLITTLALREEDRDGRMSLANFYLRRAFRILPVYYVVLGMVVVLHVLRFEYHSTGLSGAMPFYLTFTNEYDPGKVFGQSWTLGVEQKFYLVWPLLAFGLGVLAFRNRLALALVLVTGFVIMGFFAVPYMAAYAMLLIGCLLAILMHNPRTYALLRPFTHPVSGVVMVVVAAALMVSVDNIEPIFGDGGMTGVTAFAISIALLIPALVSPRGPVSWLFSTAPMRFVGERSYSLYLLQGIGTAIVAVTFPRLSGHATLTVIAVTIVSLALADMLYRWVEVPMIDVGRKVVARRNARVAAKRADVSEIAPPAPQPATGTLR